MRTKVVAFIERWEGVDGSERSNYQLFLTELCALLELPTPNPRNTENTYIFERMVPIDAATAHLA